MTHAIAIENPNSDLAREIKKREKQTMIPCTGKLINTRATQHSVLMLQQMSKICISFQRTNETVNSQKTKNKKPSNFHDPPTANTYYIPFFLKIFFYCTCIAKLLRWLLLKIQWLSTMTLFLVCSMGY